MSGPGNAFDGLDDWMRQALAAASPAARKKLLRTVAGELRKRNAKRITQQVGPDGDPWPPRKPDAQGRVRSTAKMLLGFREARRMRVTSGADGASVGYSGRNAYVASIHHYGKMAQVANNGAKVKYDARPLLGLAEDDTAWVRTAILSHLAGL